MDSRAANVDYIHSNLHKLPAEARLTILANLSAACDPVRTMLGNYNSPQSICVPTGMIDDANIGRLAAMVHTGLGN